MLVIALLGVACDRPAPVPLSDIEAYQAVVTGGLSGEQARAACVAIQAEGTRGDCIVALVQASAKEEGEGAGFCPEAPAGVWRDECWFVVAESRRRRVDREGAAAACVHAGAFADDCGQHLWQSEVRRVVVPRMGQPPRDFAEVVPELQRIHDRWAPLLAAGTDLDTRLWERAFANGFEARGWVALKYCQDLDAAYAERCRAAGATIVGLRVRSELPGGPRALCQTALDDAALWQRLRADDHPDLRRVLLDEGEAVGCTPVGQVGG
ncbi:MAG: hypothetical protein H6742_03315 [Alphaproteobacteria bacterium]|nr:hypothetical protein [Alphaproteobacteria bacterium]